MSPAPADRSLAVAAPTFTLLDRDHSILSFNERVLDWAHRPEVPLIERLRYLCIVSSNLDEFFEVRAAPHLIAAAPATTRAPTRWSRSSGWPRRPTRSWRASTRCTTTS
jgi:hypothetical protein